MHRVALQTYFFPTSLSLPRNALPCPPENIPKFGASILFTTVSGFCLSSAFTASPRTAHRYPRNANFFSSPTFTLAYAGKRIELGAPTNCCCRLTTLKGYPLLGVCVARPKAPRLHLCRACCIHIQSRGQRAVDRISNFKSIEQVLRLPDPCSTHVEMPRIVLQHFRQGDQTLLQNMRIRDRNIANVSGRQR